MSNFIEFNFTRYERQIDRMVYKLYGLTEEEVEIVEGPFRGREA